MKREIEFRAKSIDGYWVSGDLHLQCKYPHIHTAERRSVFIDPKTIGQFTGLADRKGIAIYEGDVLNCYDGYPKPWVRVVMYSADLVEETPTPGFVLANVKGVSGTDTFDEYDEFEVIGNVFDNPSLIQRPHQKPTLL